MLPQRDTGTLVDLLDRLLEKGLVLKADLIISVAGVPLIGLNLVATLAEMETMLKYGVFEALDKNTRAWALEHGNGSPSFMDGESRVCKVYCSYTFSGERNTCWKYGFVYVTDRRFFAWDKGLGKVLFEFRPEQIKTIGVEKRLYEEREREELHVWLQDGMSLFLHVGEVRELKKSLENGFGSRASSHP